MKNKLTDDDVRRLLELYRSGIHQADLARRFGVSRVCVHLLVKGKRRKSITLPPNQENPA